MLETDDDHGCGVDDRGEVGEGQWSRVNVELAAQDGTVALTDRVPAAMVSG